MNNCPKCKKSDEVVTRPDGTKYCLDCGERIASCPSDATACSEARAEVTKRITGRIASIEVGEIVKVTHNDGKTCTVERETWRGSLVEINNRVVGAPVNHLKFRPQNVQAMASADTQAQPKEQTL